MMTLRTYNWNISTMSLYILLLIMCLLFMEGETRPQWTQADNKYNKTFLESYSKCSHDGDIRELCQRCAKATKSNLAYPMCCSNEDNAVQWCQDYVYFGIQ